MTARRLPPLNALKAFEAAGRHLSFTAAAEELYVTHGAVSRQVKALEETLGVALFERHNRRVALTLAGQRLLPSVTAAFDLLSGSIGLVAPAKDTGPLTVSCAGTLIMRWLIPRLHRFHQANPDVEVRLSATDNNSELSFGDNDIAIRFGVPPWPANLCARKLFAESIGPVCTPDYARRTRLTKPADLRRAILLHTETRPSAWADWCAAVGLNQLDLRSGQRFEHFYFMLQAAASGLGAGISPAEAIVRDDMDAGRLTAPFGFLTTGRDYAVLVEARRQHDPRIQVLCTWLIAEGGG